MEGSVKERSFESIAMVAQALFVLLLRKQPTVHLVPLLDSVTCCFTQLLGWEQKGHKVVHQTLGIDGNVSRKRRRSVLALKPPFEPK